MSESGQEARREFRRPWVIPAAVVLGLILILGVVLIITTRPTQEGRTGGNPTVPTASPTPALRQPSPSSSSSSQTESVCGLSEVAASGPVSTPPPVTWSYSGTTAYPVSPQFGPGETSAEGMRFCFQHSPTGAVVAAANAAVQATDPSTIGAWLDYFVAPGPYRDTFLAAHGDQTDASGIRVQIAGFRVLEYDTQHARVDLAVRGSADGQTVILSMVYDLVWSNGDWKLELLSPTTPVNVATIPDLAGYIAWGDPGNG